MKQKVTIEENKDGKLIAGCDKNMCDGCKGSLFCTSKKAAFTVLNPENIPLEKGDEAIIDLPTKRTLFTIFMSFGLPLLMFLPGYYVGTLISESEAIHLISSLSGVAVGFLVSAIYFKFHKAKYTPIVVEKKEAQS